MLKSVKGVYTGSEVTLLEPVEETAPCEVIVTFLDALDNVSNQRQAIRDTFGAWKDDPALDNLWEMIRADRDRWGERGR